MFYSYCFSGSLAANAKLNLIEVQFKRIYQQCNLIDKQLIYAFFSWQIRKKKLMSPLIKYARKLKKRFQGLVLYDNNLHLKTLASSHFISQTYNIHRVLRKSLINLLRTR